MYKTNQGGPGPITRRSFPRDDAQGYVSARVHHRAETLRAEKLGALSDPNLYQTAPIVYTHCGSL